MFDLGMQELIVIFLVALLVFGPKRLPELGRTLGKGISELKKAMFDVKKEVYKEMYPPIEEGKEALYSAKEMWGEGVGEGAEKAGPAEGAGEKPAEEEAEKKPAPGAGGEGPEAERAPEEAGEGEPKGEADG